MLSRTEIEQFKREHTGIKDKIDKINEPRTFRYQGNEYTSLAQEIILSGNRVELYKS